MLPGDVVLGTPTGVVFIPPHLPQAWPSAARTSACATSSASCAWPSGRYTSGEIDVATWREEIEADFQQWRAARDGQER